MSQFNKLMILVTIILIVLLIPSTQADLVLEDTLAFSPINPTSEIMYANNSTNIFVSVRNTDTSTVINVTVEMLDNNILLARETIASIPANSSTHARFNWAMPDAGLHIIKFVVDPDGNFTEANINNNVHSIDITIQETPIPPKPGYSAVDVLPFFLIPIILFIVILFLFRSKPTIKVVVTKQKTFKEPEDEAMRWQYTCSYGEKITIGLTRSTDQHVELGTVIEVCPFGLYRREDGTIAWGDAEIKNILIDEEPDTEEKISKLIK